MPRLQSVYAEKLRSYWEICRPFRLEVRTSFRPSEMESNKWEDVQLINCRLVSSSILEQGWRSTFIVSRAQCDPIRFIWFTILIMHNGRPVCLGIIESTSQGFGIQSLDSSQQAESMRHIIEKCLEAWMKSQTLLRIWQQLVSRILSIKL